MGIVTRKIVRTSNFRIPMKSKIVGWALPTS
jgi:hypothetical protein